MNRLPITTVRFPELRLRTRDAHKLRGFFGTLFREHSTLLHNHHIDEHGEEHVRYSYPLVQYKILDGIPTLVGLQEGSTVLTNLFLDMRHITIENITYTINHKNIHRTDVECGIADTLYEYSFATLWFALNQHHFERYQTLSKPERLEMLNAILRGNILSFFKGVNIWLMDRVMTSLRITGTVPMSFKNHRMIGFHANFTANVLLPEWIGLGKSVGRGFGTITVASKRMQRSALTDSKL
ncbi:MAG: CRISPR-associated endonuclease Cas6 [Bacteroidota bacterium]|nr:CRISPR-associated endonuclease Cas6 [Candidatus Kapabacteria bacterium]MDW8219289.1 CRISPR-associated endonuclease Cas6 [Bacteroidota bacterium]